MKKTRLHKSHATVPLRSFFTSAFTSSFLCCVVCFSLRCLKAVPVYLRGFRELEEARDDETFLDEECKDGWSDSDKRLMGPLLGTYIPRYRRRRITIEAPVL